MHVKRSKSSSKTTHKTTHKTAHKTTHKTTRQRSRSTKAPSMSSTYIFNAGTSKEPIFVSIPIFRLKTPTYEDVLLEHYIKKRPNDIIVSTIQQYTLDDVVIDTPNTASENGSDISNISVESASTCTLNSSLSAVSLFNALDSLNVTNTDHGYSITDKVKISGDVIDQQNILNDTCYHVLTKNDFIIKPSLVRFCCTFTFDTNDYVSLQIVHETSLFSCLLPYTYDEYLLFKRDWLTDIFQSNPLPIQTLNAASLSQLFSYNRLTINDLILTPTDD